MYYYINMYLIGSFFGFLIETILKKILFPSLNNGILYGPWIPIYGLGVCIMIFVVDKIFHLHIKKMFKLLLSFFTIIILLTFLEEIAGLLIEFVFHKKFWNYSKMPFHIGPYISLEMSLLWGFSFLIFTFYIRPAFDLFIKKIPKSISIGILLLQCIDIFVTLLIS